VKNGEPDSKPSHINDEKHCQLTCDWARTRVRVCPEAVKDEVTNDGTNKGYCPSQAEGHTEHLREQVHDPEIHYGADGTDGYEPEETTPLM
jgi:hypothetical protein